MAQTQDQLTENVPSVDETRLAHKESLFDKQEKQSRKLLHHNVISFQPEGLFPDQGVETAAFLPVSKFTRLPGSMHQPHGMVTQVYHAASQVPSSLVRQLGIEHTP